VFYLIEDHLLTSFEAAVRYPFLEQYNKSWPAYVMINTVLANKRGRMSKATSTSQDGESSQRSPKSNTAPSKKVRMQDKPRTRNTIRATKNGKEAHAEVALIDSSSEDEALGSEEEE
jgi:hypothetical protein